VFVWTISGRGGEVEGDIMISDRLTERVNWNLGVTLELKNICPAKMISCRDVGDFELGEI
jgi:hypothetical protein